MNSKSKPTILLSSTKAHSGKSVVAIGLFLALKERGRNPGYFKAVGDAMSMMPKTKTDKDVNVIAAMIERKYPKEIICPVFLNPDLFLDELLPEEVPETESKIRDAFNQIYKDVDYMIMEGNHTGFQYRALGLDDAHIAKMFNAQIVICSPVRDDDDINDVISLFDFYKSQDVQVAGVILNALTELAKVRIEKYHKPLLEKFGIQFIGGLQKSRQLEKPTIAEILDAVHGRLISGLFIEVKNKTIDRFVIGAMHADKALSYFQKGSNWCVITGGDRSDVALAALETDTSAIVFTNGIEPPNNIISIAEQKKVPLIVAPGDTLTVADQVRSIHTHIQPNEILICKEQVEKYLDISKFPQ